MKYIIAVIALALVGCDANKNIEGNSQDRYVITLLYPHGYGRTIWYTPHRPSPTPAGYVFKLADGREVQVSGVVAVQEQFSIK